jgi:Beta-galactosidase trimerisation domain
MREYMDGMYYALLEGRFLFDFVHEDKLAPEDVAKYSALLLPNTALLSDEQCGQLRAYVDAGGSLLATFETSMYTERNERRSDFGLADVFGIRKNGDIIGTVGNAYLARIEKQHQILKGFSDTNWIPGAENRIPVAPVEGPILTVVPGFVAYPPELSYPLQARTNEPAIVLRQRGKSRLVYFPGDIERTMWRSGHTDLARLLQNSIRWVAGGANPPVTIEGDGVIEAFAWETQAGFAVHVLNYTNPAMHRGWIRNFYPIGTQKVTMSVPNGRRVTRVELLRAETNIPFTGGVGTIEFTIPRVLDYEVAALYAG